MLTRDTLGKFKLLLTNALRTTDQQDADLSDRFVELRPGTLDLLRADVNQLLTGRRGVGKSTTFAVLQQRVEAADGRVIFVDVESHKLRAYPDVLIELIIDILQEVRPSWSPKRDIRSTRKTIRRLTDVLSHLRDAGPELQTTTENAQSSKRGGSVEFSGSVARKFLKLGGSASRGRDRSDSRRSSSQFSKRKEDVLRDLAAPIAAALNQAAASSESGSLIVVLDDFYMIRTSEQPLVLDHLHGMAKRTKVWFKVASIQSRTQTFVNGDPPIGMQPPGDIQPLSLDVGLTDFHTAKAFLEEVTRGILAPEGFELSSILTDKARERAVLVAGGAVCRDYFELLIFASDVAWNRVQGADQVNLPFNINAEDVLEAASQLYDRKFRELRADTGLDSPSLERRLDDILAFVRERDTFFILVRRDQLNDPWAAEVVQLEDSRFLHKIMSTRPNTPKWRGVDTVVYMVDIPSLVKNRMRKAPIEFWKPGEADKLRRASWVYSEGWADLRDVEADLDAPIAGTSPEATPQLFPDPTDD